MQSYKTSLYTNHNRVHIKWPMGFSWWLGKLDLRSREQGFKEMHGKISRSRYKRYIAFEISVLILSILTQDVICYLN
jgi:hypothetical protein